MATAADPGAFGVLLLDVAGTAVADGSCPSPMARAWQISQSSLSGKTRPSEDVIGGLATRYVTRAHSASYDKVNLARGPALVHERPHRHIRQKEWLELLWTATSAVKDRQSSQSTSTATDNPSDR